MPILKGLVGVLYRKRTRALVIGYGMGVKLWEYF